MPEQVADLFECREARKVVDVVAAVREHAPVAVEIADRRRGRNDVFESALALFRYFLSHHALILCDRAGSHSAACDSSRASWLHRGRSGRYVRATNRRRRKKLEMVGRP